jgi:mono/diheme cytochrome c family protein
MATFSKRTPSSLWRGAATCRDCFRSGPTRIAARQPVERGPSFAQGRYLTTITCAECHGPDLKGVRDPRPGEPPDLAIAAVYSPEELARLLKTGIARSGQQAAGMAEEAKKRLSALSAEEVKAIRDYLVARAAP